MRTTKPTPRFVICVDNSEYPASLELHKIYRVLPDKEAQSDGDYRVIDESGEDYLFPASYFIPVDLPQTVIRVLKNPLCGRLHPLDLHDLAIAAESSKRTEEKLPGSTFFIQVLLAK